MCGVVDAWMDGRMDEGMGVSVCMGCGIMSVHFGGDDDAQDRN